MHSKVIIASLACILAASFANSRTTNISQKELKSEVEQVINCNAPNEERRVIILHQDIVDDCESGSTFVASLGIYMSEDIYQSFDVFLNPSALSVEYFTYPNGGVAAYISAPTSNGETFLSFRGNGKETGCIYFYTNNNHSCASTLSFNDARAKYYLEYVATYSEKMYYPSYGVTQITSSSGYNAVKHYADYVYGSSDITTETNTYAKTSSSQNNLRITVVVDMRQSSTLYNLADISLDLFFDGVPITFNASRKTNFVGVYNTTLAPRLFANKRVSNLQVGLFAKCSATEVKDANGFNYPYLYSKSSSTLLSNLSKVEFHITINPHVSDRSSAYLITQAETTTHWYVSSCGGSSLPAITTSYPAVKTYYSYDNIYLRKGISSSWDVICHEYAHYVSRELNLCGYFYGEDHKFNEDLSNMHGFDDGSRFAYSEGLATYIALAGLKKYGEAFGGYVNTIADYKYDDNLNNIHVNYMLDKYGYVSSAHGTCVESSVARILVKLQTSASVGFNGMWNVITNAGSWYCTIIDFVEEYINSYPQQTACLYPVLDSENIAEQYEALSGLSRIDDWTIMLYMCGSTNLADQAGEELQSILEVGLDNPYVNQPDTVNILVFYGGTDSWPLRYSGSFPINGYMGFEGRIENNAFCIEDGTNDDMGDPETLTNFINWGIREYPAKKMGLVLFNHGNALDGVCFDSRRDTHLDNDEVSQALENVYNDNPGLGGKFEFIGYDACLMQLQDIADYNSKYFNYMVASEEYTYGWHWEGFIQDIYDGQNTVTALTTLCDDFIPMNEEIFEENGEGRKACISLLDLSKMKAYRNKFETLAINIKNTVNSNRTEFLNVINQSTHYANRVGNVEISYNYEKYGTIDGYDFLTKLAASPAFSQYSSQINAVKVAYNSVVVVNGKAIPSLQSYGLAIHVCLEEYPLQTYDINQTHFYNWRNLFVA